MRPAIAVRRLAAVAAFAVAVAAGCASAPPGDGVAILIVLRRAPENLACDAVGVPYRSATFRFDPAAPEGDQVTAVTDLGDRLATWWSAGFSGGTSLDPVVRDAAGRAVARDGEQLAIPVAALPRLHGYFVCPSTNALYVLESDPG